MTKPTIVNFPVKIHFPGCKCKHYSDKIKFEGEILVSAYNKCNFKQRYYKYSSMDAFIKDSYMFPDNCLCTYHDNIYNGGVVIITKTPNILAIKNSDELNSVRYELFKNIKYEPDNSRLINNFCKLFTNFEDYYTIIGETVGDVKNFTFPKGKISLCDKNVEECCYREFKEETNCILPEFLTKVETQNIKRSLYGLQYVPLDIIIDNFVLKIVII